ncbi:hypothetical protein HYR99_20405 [Candidatus Poribacteria bacterium]|nr:hypothetical protein [Candidatus Poribacteria bacterium]
MSIKTFDIQYKGFAKNWHFDENDVVDVTELQLALLKFATGKNRYWSIFINGLELPFQYSPDLTTIFDEIPDVLEELLQNRKAPVELYFFEQGTDLSLWFSRDREMILVTFEKHEFCGKPYDHLSESEPQAISIVEFYSAWFRFLDELLALLVQENPHLAEAPSYLEYKYRIEQIRRKALSDCRKSP